LMIDASVPARLGPETRYGLGVIVRPSTPVGLTWGHSGFFPGYQTELLHVVDTGVTLAIQVNSSAPRVTGDRSLLRVLYDIAAMAKMPADPGGLPAIEETVRVSATRTGTRLEDQPMRVEVLGRDERSHPGHARAVYAFLLRRPAALRRSRRARPPADSADGPRPGGSDQGRCLVAVRRRRDGWLGRSSVPTPGRD
jgi:hypothetical protein